LSVSIKALPSLSVKVPSLVLTSFILLWASAKLAFVSVIEALKASLNSLFNSPIALTVSYQDLVLALFIAFLTPLISGYNFPFL